MAALAAGCAGSAEEPVAHQKQALSSGLVIAEVYGGGSNSGATYDHDFIVLFNRGNTAQSLNGLSLQYASNTGNFGSNDFALPDVSVPAGSYFLVQLSGGSTGSPLPTPDATGGINMSGSNGKVALVPTASVLSGCGSSSSLCDLSKVIDFVG